MKKTTRKLILRAEKVRVLTPEQVATVAGGVCQTRSCPTNTLCQASCDTGTDTH